MVLDDECEYRHHGDEPGGSLKLVGHRLPGARRYLVPKRRQAEGPFAAQGATHRLYIDEALPCLPRSSKAIEPVPNLRS
jgi:hypothetical protein